MSTRITKSSGNIFQDLGFSAVESEKLNIKSDLMSEIENYIEANGLTQEQTAERMGVSRPRISDVVRGKIDKFTIDALVDMLARVGRHVVVKVNNAA